MQTVWRPLRQGEVDHELLWLTVSAGGAALAAVWMWVGLPWPICWFHALTGQPCATCGATRATIAFFQGEFLKSWQWNPLVFVSCVMMVVFDIYAGVVFVTGARRLRVSFNPTEKRICRLTIVVLVLVNWGYLLAHSRMFNA